VLEVGLIIGGFVMLSDKFVREVLNIASLFAPNTFPTNRYLQSFTKQSVSFGHIDDMKMEEMS
jgi:hypothetical protein